MQVISASSGESGGEHRRGAFALLVTYGSFGVNRNSSNIKARARQRHLVSLHLGLKNQSSQNREYVQGL